MTERTWLESIEANHSNPWTRDILIQEAAKTHFIGSLPDAFAFLQGAFVDLGFNNLGLSLEELNNVQRAFAGSGLSIPGTTFRLRNLGPGRSVVEPADGNEHAVLPDNWRQGVVVLGLNEQYTWIGRQVSQEQHGGTDLRNYAEVGDGWVPRQRDN